MSEHVPGAGAPEYLDSAGGSLVPPDTATSGTARRGRRRSWWLAGGGALLLGAGAGAWAVLGFFHQGAQPAEVLPASTVAYLSVDLDPSGGQKIDAFRTLEKFPAFKHDVGVGSVGDLRHKLGSALVPSTCHRIDYDRDIDPWLGSRAAVALVALAGSHHPDPVVVVQVTDEGKARDGISALNDCAGGSHPAGFVVQGGWAVLAGSQQVANQVVTAAAKSSLADDATYRRWTKAVGDPGVVNAYVAPGAGHDLAPSLGGVLGGGTVTGSSRYSSLAPATGVALGDPFSEALSRFTGGAATLRFTGDGLEVAVASGGSTTSSTSAAATGGALVQRLPDDTAVAVGASLSRGWVDRQLGTLAGFYGGLSRQQAMRQLSRATGLDLPGDLETLVGQGFAVSVGKGFDVEAAQNSTTGVGLPLAATLKGDPAAIGAVLDKLRARTGDPAALGSDSAGDLVVVGPTPAYRDEVLHGGSLGDDPTFRGVVPDAGDASAVAYVDVDALEVELRKASAGDSQSLDNLTPLRALGWSTWRTAGVTHFSVRVTTD